MTTEGHTVRGTTDGAGAATVDTTTNLYGELIGVYIDGVALTNSADLTVVCRRMGVDGTAINSENLVNNGDIGNAGLLLITPRLVAEDITGADMLHAAGGTGIPIYPPVGGTLRAVIANGGATKDFAITYVIRE